MQRGRFFGQAIVLAYLCVTGAAFLHTLTRVRLPFLPFPLVYFSYGMMAPYQGDTPWNEDLLAEGQLRDGSWAIIDLDAYLPFGFGEMNIRKYLRSFGTFGSPRHREKYTALALQLLQHERERGRHYGAVRLTFEHWPRSPMGFSALRTDPFVTRLPLTYVQ